MSYRVTTRSSEGKGVGEADVAGKHARHGRSVLIKLFLVLVISLSIANINGRYGSRGHGEV